MPVVQPVRQGLLAQGGEAGLLLPAPEPRQQFQVAGGAERLGDRLKGQLPLPSQPLEGGPQGLALLGGKPGEDCALEPFLQHIEVTGEAGAAGEGGDAAAAHPLGQLQGGGELAQGGAKPPQADAELMQGFRVCIRQHLTMQGREAPRLALDLGQGVDAVAGGRKQGDVHQRSPGALSPACNPSGLLG